MTTRRIGKTKPSSNSAVQALGIALLQQHIASMSENDASLKTLKGKHPWMFPHQHLGMEMPRNWLPVFASLCDDISQLLGEQRQGFHWRYLGVTSGKGSGEPVWLWRFEDDGEILLAKALGKTSLWALQLPASDPSSDLFQGIQEWVHNARQRALETEQVPISQPRTFPKKKSKKSSNEP